jgi:gliding motility-associated-like protein
MNNAGCDSIITLKLTITPSYNHLTNATICDGETYTFSGTTYTSKGTFSHNLKTLAGCDSIETLVLNFYPPINAEARLETPLMKAYPKGDAYQWLDCINGEPIAGADSQIFHSQTHGEYAVRITKDSCVEESPCVKYSIQEEIILPNAFSPNGDGINDVFYPQVNGWNIVKMSIYNKWGEMVYESSSPDANWDGTYAGKPVQQDIYIVMIVYQAMESGNAPKRYADKKFSLHLIR